MFRVKAGTLIEINALKTPDWDWGPKWIPYVTTETKLYDTHEVINLVSVYNNNEDVKPWMRRNVLEHNKVVLMRDGRFALVKRTDIEFLD